MLYGVLSADSLRQRFRGTIADYRLLAVIAIAAFAVWVPQLIYWKEMTGQWLYYSYGSNERFFFGDPAIIKVSSAGVRDSSFTLLLWYSHLPVSLPSG